jgi:hypothetical protein
MYKWKDVTSGNIFLQTSRTVQVQYCGEKAGEATLLFKISCSESKLPTAAGAVVRTVESLNG